MALTQTRKRFIGSAVVVFITQLPLMVFYANSPAQLVVFLLVFVLGAALIGAVYKLLTGRLRADASEPMPWYGSPLVWLGAPLALVWLVWWLG